jgi:hypothetical protein
MESKKRVKFNPASETTGKQMYEIAEKSRKEYTEEPIEGFGLRELDYIMELDIQEYFRVRKEIDRLVRLTEDICLHYKEVKDCHDLTLERMECNEASKHFEDYMNLPQESREPDPCEVPDYDGNFQCPFDSQGPDDCRRHCGLGVDK